MSTPVPGADRITLPRNKIYTLVIDSEKYPDNYPAELTFNMDPTSFEWTANFSVPSVLLTMLGRPVSEVVNQYRFDFSLEKSTKSQQEAGYINGDYTFTFAPPGVNPAFFGGIVKDPWHQIDGAEDIFTATGNDPETEVAESKY